MCGESCSMDAKIAVQQNFYGNTTPIKQLWLSFDGMQPKAAAGKKKFYPKAAAFGYNSIKSSIVQSTVGVRKIQFLIFLSSIFLGLFDESAWVVSFSIVFHHKEVNRCHVMLPTILMDFINSAHFLNSHPSYSIRFFFFYLVPSVHLSWKLKWMRSEKKVKRIAFLFVIFSHLSCRASDEAKHKNEQLCKCIILAASKTAKSDKYLELLVAFKNCLTLNYLPDLQAFKEVLPLFNSQLIRGIQRKCALSNYDFGIHFKGVFMFNSHWLFYCN